jgi:hypothetical protein
MIDLIRSALAQDDFYPGFAAVVGLVLVVPFLAAVWP